MISAHKVWICLMKINKIIICCNRSITIFTMEQACHVGCIKDRIIGAISTDSPVIFFRFNADKVGAPKFIDYQYCKANKTCKRRNI